MGRLAEGINALIDKIHTVVCKVRESSLGVLSAASQIAATARQQEATVQGLNAPIFHDIQGVAIVRVEQLYPFPADQLREVLDSYPNADELYWVQEEPENMGAWRLVQLNAQRRLGVSLRSVAREESASPATGSLRIHQREQAALLDAAFAGLKTSD